MLEPIIKEDFELNPTKKSALVTVIILTLLYAVSILPLLFLTGLLLMSIAVFDSPFIYFTIVAYLLSILITVPRAIYLYKKQQYKATVKTILAPLGFAVLFMLAFYINVISY